MRVAGDQPEAAVRLVADKGEEGLQGIMGRINLKELFHEIDMSHW